MKLNPFARRREQRNALDALATALIGGSVSTAGVRVNEETALASVAIAACVEVRAETFSALPGGVFRKVDRKREQLTDHPVHGLLFDRPNELMTSGEMLRWKQMRQDITGNAYLRVVWRNGRPRELWPLYGTANPEVRTANGKIAYRYHGDDITPAGDYPAADILAFKGPFLKNPLEAKSPIELIRDTIGLSIASEQFFGRFLNNGSHFPIYAETDAALTVDDVKAIAKSIQATSGVMNAGTMRIFDRGLKIKQNQMSLRDADLTGQMRWYLEQICRIYRVPLPLVQDWTHGTYTNSEQAGLWFAQHTIAPIAVDTERVARRLFIPGEENLYVKWNLDAVLRGDYTTRTQGYQSAINAGWMNRNEARALEDMDPFDGGDDYLVPLNMATQDQAATATDTINFTQRSILQPVLDDAIERIKIRAKQDHERGRDLEATQHYALETVMPAVRAAYEAAGLDLDVEAVITTAIEA